MTDTGKAMGREATVSAHVPVDPMDGCPQCKWAADAYGTHLMELCPVHLKLNDLKADAALERSILADQERLLTKICEALRPFAAVCDAYDYFIPEVMPNLQFPVAGTLAPDPGYERELSDADFHAARTALRLATGEEKQRR